MTSRERLLATLQGEPVDRPAVNFYEIGGLVMDPEDPDPFNVYHDPSWRPLLELAEKESDLIRMRSAVRAHSHEAWDTAGTRGGLRAELMRTETRIEGERLLTRTVIRAPGRILTSLTRREAHVDTLWTEEPLLKSPEDAEAYLNLPDEFFEEEIDLGSLESEEEALGERGLVMVDTEDPLCAAAGLFSQTDYAITAMTERKLFHRLLEKCARYIHRRTEEVARRFPGRLWRIYGPEYATEPYLPPELFVEYVVRYTRPMVETIRKYGGFARIHCHGRLKKVLPHIEAMGADALDPIEPPPYGDVELGFVRREYGKSLVLFGNIEVKDVERMEPRRFRELVKRTLEEGTAGEGRGFVLMPTAAPFGRRIPERALANYRILLETARDFTA